MAITKQVNGANTTVTITYTAPTTQIEAWLGDAAKNLYGSIQGHGVVLSQGETVENLTNAEIGDIVFAAIKSYLKEHAKTYRSISAQDTARLSAETEAATRYF